ncbi:GWT1 protein [Dictyocaulus viviparus]|uniref:Phosphatidylinositol-glycan biosynthesis class W protein n=1 Tax=Dictyocaulus viviparus TaxID=29172 RepID=A0A0D8Y606_DICVI|nr:GWT1 protein [Dictyocaulus viviparus]
MTMFSESLLLLASVQSACLATLLLFIICEYFISLDRPAAKVVLNTIIDENHQPTMFLTYFRSYLLVFVAVAILAVDFQIFPRRFSKTEKYGHSLMDVGVAGFVFAAAVSKRLKALNLSNGEIVLRKYGLLRSSYVVLPLAGLLRTFMLTFMNYPHNVTEYGVHWNFFYTLSLVKIIYNSLPRRFPLLWALVFGILQQSMLMSGYEEWILNGENRRDTWFSANAEGLCSLMGYIMIFYISDAVAKFICKTGIRVKSWIECCWHLYFFSLVFYGLQLGTEWTLGQPSRRVANIPYVFSQMSFFTFSLATCLGVQLLSIIAWAANVPHFSVDQNPWCSVQPCLLSSINKSGLMFFLLANIFTGVINLVVDSHHANDEVALCILTFYLLTLCIVAHYRNFSKASTKS